MKPRTLIETTENQAFSNAELRATPTHVRKNNKNSIMLATLAVLLLGVVAMVFSFQDKKSHLVTHQNAASESNQIALPEKYMDAFIWTAKLKLEDLQLNHRLEINTTASNALNIAGSVSPEELPRWESFLTWYKTKDGFPELTHSVAADAVTGNIPKLKSVWFNKSPTAYFTDGNYGKIGSVLKDGWKIVSIEPWAVFIERNGKTITLVY